MFQLNDLNDARIRKQKYGAYTLLTYKKPVDHPSLKAYRSVVFKDDRIVCFSPPQCIPLEEFKEKHPFETIVVEPFVDGTMINAFYDEEWKFATKSNVGCSNTFYNRSFAQLLHEVEIPPMDPTFCYSFVLMHPDCRNVTPVGMPRLILVASYRIDGVNIDEHRHLPRVFLPSYADVENAAENLPWSAKGYMLTAGGDRAKVMSPAFLEVSEIKGNDSQFPFRYLELCQANLVPQYLEFFPERKAEAAHLRRMVDSFGESLFRHYRERTSPYAFVPHLNALRKYHGIFLKPLPLTAIDVHTYVSALPPAKLMYALNNINR